MLSMTACRFQFFYFFLAIIFQISDNYLEGCETRVKNAEKVMDKDIMQSIAELDEMVKSLKQDKLVDPHRDERFDDEEEESAFSIKHGAYVRVSDDSMRAWVWLNPPGDGEDYYSRSLIKTFLEENGIVTGFHESNIAAIAKKHVYEREILVARGAEPDEGKDGYYEFFFDTSDKRKPSVREDGTVDYSSMSSLSNVNAGDVIAKYHHSTPSRNGYDVYGNEIPIKPPKELPPLKGRGFKNDRNPDEYIATESGKIDYVDGRIDIKNVHEIHGDVDLVTGKVEFYGDVHITGNVSAGVLVRASRNLTIDGVVEAATLYAGGDVVLSRGMQGGGKGKIIAKGDVSAEFLEFTNVEAEGTVRSNSIINSNVSAGNMVIAEGRKGTIIGGNVRGLLGLTAQTTGTEKEARTVVSCGYSQEDYDNYLASFTKESDIQRYLSEVVERMTRIVKEKRAGTEINPEASEAELEILNERKDEFFEKLDQVKADKEKLAAIIEKGKGSMVIINDKIYRGTVISIEGTNFAVKDNTCYMRYRNEAGKIVGEVIVYN